MVMGCQYKVRRGEKCAFKGQHQYNSQYLCGTHLRVVKSKEDCSVCMTPMSDPTERIKLRCGHYFHVDCLSYCPKAECPLCRKQLEPDEACIVYHSSLIKPLFTDIFKLPIDCQAHVLACARLIVNFAQRGAWLVDMLYHVLLRIQTLSTPEAISAAINTFFMS